MVNDKPTVKDTEDKNEDENKVEELDYNEIHNDSIDEIQRAAVEDKTGEANAEGKNDEKGTKPADDTTSDTTTDTTKPTVEAKKEETPPTPPAPAVDENKLSQKVAEDVIKALTANDDTKTKEEKDEIDELVKTAPWVAEGRNPTYAEVISWTAKATAPMIKKQVLDDLKKEADEEETRETQAREQQETEKKAYNERMWTEWDRQFDSLERAGKIPSVEDKNNQNDPGLKARIRLFEKMQAGIAKATVDGTTPVTNLTEVFLHTPVEELEPETKVLDRARNAPVAGNRKSVVAPSPDDFSYADIHNADMSDIIREASTKSSRG